MEFEFRKDFISGNATIKTSMDHEAFATWLEMEGQSAEMVTTLLTKVAALQAREISEHKLIGSEFSLLLNNEEAHVINHRLMGDENEEELTDDLSFYNAEVEGECGLEDFNNLIQSWLEFIS